MVITSAEVVAEGLGFPEGPLVLPDGRLAFVEEYRGCVSVLEDGRVRELAYLGGAPNGLALGPDGRIYVARTAGKVGAWMTEDPQAPAIVAVSLDGGDVEVVATEANGRTLRAPNDLCFGPDGALWFTDPADFDPEGDFGGWVCRLDGGGCTIAHAPGNVFPNGIGFDGAGRLVWAETHSKRLVAAVDGQPTTIADLADDSVPDGFAFTTDGRAVVATLFSGGIDVVDWSSGSAVSDRITWADDVVPTNLAFQGSTLWVTDVTPGWEQTSPFTGRLWRLETDLVGADLH